MFRPSLFDVSNNTIFFKQNVFYIRNVRQGMGKTLTGTLTFSAMASLA